MIEGQRNGQRGLREHRLGMRSASRGPGRGDPWSSSPSRPPAELASRAARGRGYPCHRPGGPPTTSAGPPACRPTTTANYFLETGTCPVGAPVRTQLPRFPGSTTPLACAGLCPLKGKCSLSGESPGKCYLESPHQRVVAKMRTQTETGLRGRSVPQEEAPEAPLATTRLPPASRLTVCALGWAVHSCLVWRSLCAGLWAPSKPAVVTKNNQKTLKECALDNCDSAEFMVFGLGLHM